MVVSEYRWKSAQHSLWSSTYEITFLISKIQAYWTNVKIAWKKKHFNTKTKESMCFELRFKLHVNICNNTSFKN